MVLSNESGNGFGKASPGPEDGTLRTLYRELDDTGKRLRNLELHASPYTRVETEIVRRRHDEIAERIRLLIARRRKV